MTNLPTILNSNTTVFDRKELKLLMGIENENSFKSFLQRVKKKKLLFSYYKGIRTKKHFDILAFASKIKTKSYISCQTVLQKHGIIFQDWSHTITLLSDNSLHKEIPIEDTILHIHIKKIQKQILSNPLFIENTGTYQIASPERAVCDMLYFDNNFYFDTIDSLNKEKLLELSTIYPKKTKESILSLIEKIG